MIKIIIYNISLIMGLLILQVADVFSQSVQLDFPHFAEQGWYFRVFQGEKTDTIAKGSLDATGHSVILLPEKYKEYRGMAQWILTNGGGLDMVIDGKENIRVSCPDANPEAGNIKFDDTPENTFLIQRHRKQQDLFGKIDAMRMAVETYKEDAEARDTFDKLLGKEMQNYESLQAETNQSQLYAARFAQIVDLTRGYGKSLSKDIETNNKELKDFIVHQMKLSDLYTSGHWNTVLSMWLESFARVEGAEKDIDQLLLSEYNTILDRTADAMVKEAFAATTHFLLANNGKKKIADQIGRPAQDFSIDDITKLSDIGGNRLLFFYASFCNLCQDELKAMKQNYQSLTDKGITVIGIDSETSEQTFQPWQHNLIDPSFTIFQKYSIEQTPTYVYIDKNGIVRGRYTQLKEFLK